MFLTCSPYISQLISLLCGTPGSYCRSTVDLDLYSPSERGSTPAIISQTKGYTQSNFPASQIQSNSYTGVTGQLDPTTGLFSYIPNLPEADQARFRDE